MLVHRNYFNGKKNKKELRVGFELASSIIRVLGLAHYTAADDISYTTVMIH